MIVGLFEYQTTIIECPCGGIELVQNILQSNEDHWHSPVDETDRRCSSEHEIDCLQPSLWIILLHDFGCRFCELSRFIIIFSSSISSTFCEVSIQIQSCLVMSS